jgi:hypothetical protein
MTIGTPFLLMPQPFFKDQRSWDDPGGQPQTFSPSFQSQAISKFSLP